MANTIPEHMSEEDKDRLTKLNTREAIPPTSKDEGILAREL